MTGTGSLTRLALRLERVRLPIWLAVLVMFVASSSASFQSLTPDVAARAKFVAPFADDPTYLMLYGRVYDATVQTVGGLTVWRLDGFLPVLVALMSIFLVTRHTRAEEEAGRLELVGAAVVERRAPLSAALATAVLANLVLAVLIAVSMIGLGEGAAGAVAFGLAYAGVGLVFAALAAVTAQAVEGARAANGLSVAVLAAAYVVRGAGNAMSADGPGRLSWLSPLGWAGAVRAYAGERWWVLVLPLACSAVLVWVAFALVARRDLGAGLVAPRPGPAVGALGGPFALAWRLQRGMLVAWTVGFALLGAVAGSVARGVGDIVGDNEQMADIVARMGGKGSLVDAYFAALMGIFGGIAAAYTAQSALRLRGEETALRAEPVLATRVSRLSFAASHLVYPFLGTVVLLTAMGVTAGLVYGADVHDVGAQVPRLLGAALVMVPACWVVAGLATAAFGVLPRVAAGVSWAVVGVCLALAELGPLLRLNHWVMDVSPFSHVPKLPSATVAVQPLLWLTVVAVAAAGLGVVGWRRRDVG